MRSAHLRAGGLLAVLLAAVVTACRSTIRETPSGGLDGDWRTAFLASAGQVGFADERAPEPDSGVPATAYPRGAPRMMIATPRGRRPGVAGRLAARISSEGEYPRLGISRGVNYVWSDSVADRGRRYLVIPADTKRPVRVLAVTTHQHVPDGAPDPAPRMVVVSSRGLQRLTVGAGDTEAFFLVFCGGCDLRPPPWCRGDSADVDAAFREPSELAFQSFFKANAVRWRGR